MAYVLAFNARRVRTDAPRCTSGGKPGPNDLLPCGSPDPTVREAVRRRHLALGQQCALCDVSVDGPPADLYHNRRTA